MEEKNYCDSAEGGGGDEVGSVVGKKKPLSLLDSANAWDLSI